MGIAEEVEIVPLRLTDDAMAKLLEFDADSQRINFPHDSPNPAETSARIRAEYADEPTGMFLITHRGAIVGCLFLKTKHNPYRGCHFLDLRDIYLTASYRGQRIGAKLLAFMEDYARKKGCRYLYLGTSWENGPARALFSSFGFRPTRIIMEKELG